VQEMKSDVAYALATFLEKCIVKEGFSDLCFKWPKEDTVAAKFKSKPFVKKKVAG
jgi:hypothetical protein